MLAAGAGKALLAACMLLLVGSTRHAAAAPGDVGPAAIGPAETDLCEEPVVLEPGLHLVHCISPTIRMTPGQVQPTHSCAVPNSAFVLQHALSCSKSAP